MGGVSDSLRWVALLTVFYGRCWCLKTLNSGFVVAVCCFHVDSLLSASFCGSRW